MAKPESLEYWRNYFRLAKSDIFGIIDHAIMVAASDCPTKLRIRRDRIAERLFAIGARRCSDCNRAELSLPSDCADLGDGDGGDEAFAGASKVINSSSREDETTANLGSHVSSSDIEALTDEMEEESLVVGEVLRIKEVLQSSSEESDAVLFESLRRLQLMALSVDTLKATEIGKTVNRFRKHGSQEIRDLARKLIDGWKDMVDELINAVTNCTEGTPDSINPSVLDEEEGLPSPPLDELAFFTAPTTSIELSRFFDGMDDDGNPQELKNSRENGRKPSAENQNVAKRKPNPPHEASAVGENNNQQLRKQGVTKPTNHTSNTDSRPGRSPRTSNVQNPNHEMRLQQKVDKPSLQEATAVRENKNQQLRKQEGATKPTNHASNTDSRPGRPPRTSTVQNPNHEIKLQHNVDKPSLQKRPLARPQDRLKRSGEEEVQLKLEASKRKLQERYQQAENAKKQRTTQLVELHDLPKQGLGHRNPHMKPGNHNRHRAN